MHITDFPFAFNTTYHSSLKTWISYLNFGRDLGPMGTPYKQLKSSSSELPRPVNVDTWTERVKKLEALGDVMKRHLDADHNKQEHAYNFHVRLRTYQIVDKQIQWYIQDI